MPHLFPSAEWAAAYQKALNENPAYKEAGKDWTHGVVAMIVKAEPALGIPDDVGMWLDVHQGQCREARLVTAAEAQSAPAIAPISHTCPMSRPTCCAIAVNAGGRTDPARSTTAIGTCFSTRC